ncbi:MAG: DUF3667 domain-containing protein [Cyclobacteriaceae bacterium]
MNIDEVYNFCPNCGQENTNRNVNFKDLVREFFNNYFSFDSKFGRSFKPFFLRPGKLTNEFIRGRRVNYANPIRLYLILSLFFFFVLSKYNSVHNDDRGKGQISFNIEDDKVPDEVALEKKEKEKEKILKQLETAEKEVASQSDTTSSWPFGSKKNRLTFIKYSNDLTITESQLYDSMDITGLSTFDKLSLKQTIRIVRSSNKEMIGYVIEQMPFMMFIMLPIFALIMKLLYHRRKHNYIIHLVHALHQHSLKFFLIGLAFTIGIFLERTLAARLITGAFILSIIYVYISFINVYKQGYIKTFLKFGIYYFVYMFLLMIGLLIEMTVSLAFY